MKLKRIMAMVLCFAMVLSTMSFSVFAEDTTVNDETALAEALATGGRVVLGRDIEVATSVEIPEGVEVTLDLAGFDIIGGLNGTKHVYALTNRGSLTIEDSLGDGEIISRGIYNYAGLVLEGGTIDACDGDGGMAINNEPGARFIMNGGVVIASNEDGDAPVSGNFDATAIENPAGCETILNGGEVISVTNFTYAVVTSGDLKIPEDSTVVVTGAHGALSIGGGQNTIEGGEFICSGYAGQTGNIVYIYGSNTNVEITGGTFTHKGEEVGADSGAAVLVTDASAVVNISGGSFTGLNGALSGNANTTVTGGTFLNGAKAQNHYDDVSEYVPAGFEFDPETGMVVESAPAEKIVAEVEGELYTDIQEAIVAAAPNGTVEIVDDVTVDVWEMFWQGDATFPEIIYIDMDGLTINGHDHTITVKDIVSSGNGNQLFKGATELNVNDLTINVVNGTGGIGLESGTIKNVTFTGGVYGIYPGEGNIAIEGCDFATNGTAIYYEAARDHLVVDGCEFNQPEGVNVILLHGNTTFTNNIVNSGRTVNVVSGSPVVTGNDFGEVRFKVYNEANATISENTINNLVFNEPTEPMSSTFGENTLSPEAQTALNAVTPAPAGPVAKIGNDEFESIQKAVDAAEDGDVIVVTANHELTWDGETVIDGALAAYVCVAGKAVTIDLNGKQLTGNTDKLNGEKLYAAFAADEGGSLTLKDDVGNGSVTVTGEADAYCLLMGYEAGTKLTVEGGTYHLKKASDSLVYSGGSSGIVTVTGGNFMLDNVGVGSNGKPWMFNAYGNNQNHVTVTGGTYNANVFNQYWRHEVQCDGRYAARDNGDGTWTVVPAVAYVVKDVDKYDYYIGYETINKALEAAEAGETVMILEGNYNQNLNVNKAITVAGETTDTGDQLAAINGKLNITADGATVKGLYVYNDGENAAYISAKDVLVEGCEIASGGKSAFRSCYTEGTVTFRNNVIAGDVYGIHFDGKAGGKIVIENCKIQGWTSFASTIEKVTISGSEFADAAYNVLRFYQDAEVTNTTFTEGMRIDSGSGGTGMEGIDLKFNDCEMADGSDFQDCFPNGVLAKSDVYVDEVQMKPTVAKIDDERFETLQAAVEAAEADDVIKLFDDITISSKLTITENLTLDGNNHTITYTGSDRVIDIPLEAASANVTIKDLTIVAESANRGINYNTNGTLTVENVIVTMGEDVDSYAINFPAYADNATVVIKDSELFARIPVNVWGSDMTISIVDSDITSVETSETFSYSAIQLNSVGNDTAEGTTVTVTGGSITALDEKGDPSIAVSNCTITGGVSISDTTVIGEVKTAVATVAGVYYYSLQDAIDGVVANNYNAPITLIRDITLTESVSVPQAAKNTLTKSVSVPQAAKITLNLNGKTITGIDNATGNYGLINIQPGAELTIDDATDTGKITLTSTNNRGWNAYSSVISNQRGKLTVNGGTIEHLGGTDMAYGIDNLTNGKGTYAETIVNGGTVKSTYRAIRQFLNGTEAQNILTVNGGTVEGANKAIWMQDPNKNANSGKITIGENADVNGSVYLYVTAGSTEWPVEVNIAASAVDGIAVANVPAGYEVVVNNGYYGVTTDVQEYVAEINGVKFTTLQKAFDYANTDDVISLIDDIDLGDTTVVNTKTVTLDLNGKIISGEKADNATSNHEMMLNKGNLTIVDSVGDGKITYEYTGESTNYGSATNTITNNPGAVITVESGILENTTNRSKHISYVIDARTNGNSGDSTVVVNNGTILSSAYSSIRGFANSTTNKVDITINDGNITGQVHLQDSNAGANNGSLTVNDGTFNATNPDAYTIYQYGLGDAGNMSTTINGGTFNGLVYITGTSITNNFNSSITGGVFNDAVWVCAWGENNALTDLKVISGGTFSNDVSDYVAEGYASIKSENTGLWNVSAARKIALVPSVVANSEGELVVKAGDTFTVDVKTEGINAGGVRWVLDYVDTKFTLDDIDTHGFNVVKESADHLTVDIADTIADGSTVATYTFTALNDAVVDSPFTLTYTELMTVDEAWKEMDVTDITIAVNTDITIELSEIKYTATVDGVDINAPEYKNPSYDGKEHKFIVTVTEPEDAVITYTVDGEDKDSVAITKDGVAITKEGVWNIGYTITKEGYEPVNETYTLIIEQPEFEVEVGMTEPLDYVLGYKLVLVYTNADEVAFDYNGIQMLDASDSQYLFENTKDYDHVFALVVEAIQTTDIEDYKKLVTVDYEDDAAVIDYDPANDVNFSNTVNFNDIVAAYAVLEKDKDTFANYMAGVIKADVDFSKTANTLDMVPIIKQVYAE